MSDYVKPNLHPSYMPGASGLLMQGQANAQVLIAAIVDLSLPVSGEVNVARKIKSHHPDLKFIIYRASTMKQRL